MLDPAIKRSFDAGLEFGKTIAEYGYRGVFDIDLIRGKQNKMYAVEANLRRNGGTHLHELALSLLGKKYANKYHVLIEDIILKKDHSLTYSKCKEAFSTVLYSHKKRAGIIFSNPDMLSVNILVIVVIGKTEREIKKLRGCIDEKLKKQIVNGNLGERDW